MMRCITKCFRTRGRHSTVALTGTELSRSHAVESPERRRRSAIIRGRGAPRPACRFGRPRPNLNSPRRDAEDFTLDARAPRTDEMVRRDAPLACAEFENNGHL